MTLTHRQAAIVQVLLDLYREAWEPVSYRDVAARIGVSAPTAYRLLRLAEARGYVRAVYAPRPSVGGVGRSAVLFAPTAAARRLVAELTASDDDADWDATKHRVLEALSAQQPSDAQSLRELLAELDMPASSLATAGRLIAALMIALEEARPPGEGELPVRLVETGGRLGVAALGGLLVGLAWTDRARQTVSDRLRRHLQRFTDALAMLSPAEEADLTQFVAQLGGLLRARREQQAAHDAMRGRGGGPDAALTARPPGL